MPQDIQSFSDIMDIDTQNKLIVTIDIKIHREPNYIFTVNGKFANTIMYFDLLDDLVFEYKNLGGDGALEIVDISVNGHHILPLYLNHGTPPTNWLENIDWRFVIPAPFYSWHQEITGQGAVF